MSIVGPLKIKAQILCGADFAMGPGKAGLLEAIDREGSISAAGRALGMSYRRAWLLVDTMNRCWAERLVDTLPGGGARRGAKLTECARTVLAAFRGLEAGLMQASRSSEMETLSKLMRDEPRTSQNQPDGKASPLA